MASDISCLVAATILSVLPFYHCMVFLFSMAHVCLGVSPQDGERTSAGAAMAEAHCIFESFGDGHVVCCGEGVSDLSYTLPALSTIHSFIHREVARHGQTVLARAALPGARASVA